MHCLDKPVIKISDLKIYKYELHCHTKETSQCGKVCAAEIVEAYKQKGYDGIVITDHYSDLTFRWKKLFCPQKHIDYFLSGFRAAKKAAGDDFTVLLGMELRFYATVDDFLIYGVTEDFLRTSGNLMCKTLKKVHSLTSERGFVLVEAHPFRKHHLRWNPRHLDGSEVFNGKDKGTVANKKAHEWAKKNGFSICTSGSDFHSMKHLALGGIMTKEPIKTNEDLLRILKSGEYSIIE